MKTTATSRTDDEVFPDLAFPEPSSSHAAASDGDEDKSILDDSVGVWPTITAEKLPAVEVEDSEKDEASADFSTRPLDPPATAGTVVDDPAPSAEPAPPEEEFAATGDYQDFLEGTVSRAPSVVTKDSIEKMGIVGAKGVGKSYLFQAIVFRTLDGSRSGALSHYIEHDGTRLFASLDHGGETATVNLPKFLRNYSQWIRLPDTLLLTQKWYRLRLFYRTGLLGQKRSQLDVEYFDGSGEGFFAAMRTAENRKLWRDGYLEARVMVFCLPAWAAFPNPTLSHEDWERRDEILEEFAQVVDNFRDLRDENHCTHPVKTILALTMADDSRCALETLQEKWITPYLEAPAHYLKEMSKSSGVASYLDSARKVSEALHEELSAATAYDPRVGAIRQHLTMGAGKPWIVPVSAIDGSMLAHVEAAMAAGAGLPPGHRAPVPAHVELPLLVALCERTNALF